MVLKILKQYIDIYWIFVFFDRFYKIEHTSQNKTKQNKTKQNTTKK